MAGRAIKRPIDEMSTYLSRYGLIAESPFKVPLRLLIRDAHLF